MSSTLAWEERKQKMQRKQVVQKGSNFESPNDDDIQFPDTFQPDSSLLIHFQENTLREYMRSAEAPNNILQTSPLLSHVDIFATCAEVLCSPEDPGALKCPDSTRILQKYAANYWMAHFKQIIDIATPQKDRVKGQTYTISAPDEVVTRVVECFSRISSNENDVVKVNSNMWTARIGHLIKLTASRNCCSTMQEPATMTSLKESPTLSNSGRRRPLKTRQFYCRKR
jgi:hypothetical protein